MRRYAHLVLESLRSTGHDVTLQVPQQVLNVAGGSGAGIGKWIGYVDKYALAAPQLARAARTAQLVHICDHSNSIYVPSRPRVPYVVTCHDLLAVRGSLGEDTDCPASFTGRRLQQAILRGLRRAQALACVSGATLSDARRLLVGYTGRLALLPNALNYPFKVLDAVEVERRLAVLPRRVDIGNYVLHVGSNLRRKNREGALRALALTTSSWSGQLLFAGQPLTAELRQLARTLRVHDRIVEVDKPSDELLEALYNGALALLFPSRFEGFGWPIIEAQACGCPVLCSDRPPFPEVAGGAAIMCDADDAVAFAAALRRLASQPELRRELRSRGRENARRYGRASLIEHLLELYAQVLAAV